jgi:hypothetical protein
VSGDWSVSGGGTGIEARFDDMLAVARVLDDAADALRARGTSDAAWAVDGDVLEAGILCPVEMAEVESAVLAATALHGGALAVGLQMEALALVVESGVGLYRDADELLGDLKEDLEQGLAFGTGVVLGSHPLLLVGLGLLAARDPEGVQELLYDHPWLLEAATRGAPGLVQGGAFGLATLLGPLGAPVLAALTGGRWPTTDYEQSVAGLQALLGLGGLVQDTGTFEPRRSSAPVDPRFLDTSAEHFLGNLAARESNVAYGDPPKVEIVPVVRDGETVGYVVQIPGTDPTSGFRHGSSPYDWTTDVQEMTGEGSQVRAAIVRALESAELHGRPVMLSGHSLGGILAASMAADDDIRERFNVQSVVTYGSPVARFDIPDDVSVLSIEHRQDVVPQLEGRDNPDGASWTTVRTDDPHRGGDLVEAHDHGPQGYGQTLSDLDSLDGVPAEVRDAMQDWRDRNQMFFGNGTADHEVYELEHRP